MKVIPSPSLVAFDSLFELYLGLLLGLENIISLCAYYPSKKAIWPGGWSHSQVYLEFQE
jgi:hypothetical protein